MSVSYNYDRRHVPHQDSSSSYDQGYNSQPQHYSHSVASDGFSDISFDPYNSKQTTPTYSYGGYTNNVFSPDDGRRKFDVQRQPLNDGQPRARDSSLDSDVYSHHRPPSIISSVGRDADVESIASHRTMSTVTSYGAESNTSSYDQYRYNGELYKPVAAPRKVNTQVKKLFGEIHPRMLRPEEKPIVESGEETEDSMSIDLSAMPRPAPRASMRLHKSRSVAFIEDEAIRLENSRLTSILKSPSMPARLDMSGNKMVVRFEHVDKYADNKSRRDVTDYSDVDSDHGKRRSKKNKQKDIWSHVAPVGPKPARNARSNSQKSSTKERRRSSSADRSRQSQRSGSRNRSSSTSSISKRGQQSPSMSRKGSRGSSLVHTNGHTRSDDNDADVEDGQVSIKMPEASKSRRTQSMLGDIQRSEREGRGMCSDSQKCCKWGLIIGVPTALIIVTVIIVVVVFTTQG